MRISSVFSIKHLPKTVMSFSPKIKSNYTPKRLAVKLNSKGEQLTAENGLLVLASCSSRVVAQSFFDINSQVLASTNRHYNLV